MFKRRAAHPRTRELSRAVLFPRAIPTEILPRGLNRPSSPPDSRDGRRTAVAAGRQPAVSGLDSVWTRAGAAIYDPFLALGERRGMRDRRAALLAGARGRVLEIGAGTGLNLPFYAPELDALVLSEPEEGMARRLESRRTRERPDARVVRASADALPFADASFDAVVSTMVLLYRARPGGRGRRDPPRAASRRSPALPRAHPRRRPAGPPAGPLRARVGRFRGRLPLRPPDARAAARGDGGALRGAPGAACPRSSARSLGEARR